MSNLVTFPNARKAREEACEWLVRLDEGLSPEERDELREWLKCDRSHATFLLEMAAHWDEQTALAKMADVLPLGSDLRTRRPKRIFALLAAACAAVAFLVLGAMTAARLYGEGDPRASGAATAETASTVAREYQTAVGEQLSIQLVDGSLIVLNTDSQLEVRYSGVERSVRLNRGEASFDVARDSRRPFRVHAAGNVVQAVGTLFNVQLDRGRRLELTVTEGVVRISPSESAGIPKPPAAESSAPMQVSAGEVAIVEDDEITIRRPSAQEIEAELSWQQGILVFRGETLEAVVEEVQRYTTARIVIADEAIRDVRVGGRFRVGDVDNLLLALRQTFGVEATRRSDGVIALSAQ